ncbi:MOSC N-terminal beta barrel domain-containing protein [Phormidium sp. FACHB-1136]|uniref:MOSC domain-containing protein n=1 Tax=Phormidium sp. FACHB-1136 TaxID=2692848 RepID=UPI001687ADA8|nr:MOSC N-terminal beta barrel domain-containing protein [Phormidium sp. FACHB-1136]MBD2427520.1 MOSC N-terminal beta barrel domain-containing protein [Phormidium sp. FACHB-1136]
MTPYLAHINLFPIKSLDGVAVPEAAVLASGALQGDRTYALFDTQGRFIHAKRTAAIHRLRASYSEDLTTVTCAADPLDAASFQLPGDLEALAAWLGQALQQPVTVKTNADLGFPDDTAAAGPTVISTATLETVASWYPGLTLEEVRRRFRSNLEMGGVPPFWEDRLFSASGDPVPFTLGEVVLEGINPCQRCPVPTRDALTGETTPDFQRMFTEQRRATLPPWVAVNRFNHFYRLGVNTVIRQQGGKRLRVGDGVRVG